MVTIYSEPVTLCKKDFQYHFTLIFIYFHLPFLNESSSYSEVALQFFIADFLSVTLIATGFVTSVLLQLC